MKRAATLLFAAVIAACGARSSLIDSLGTSTSSSSSSAGGASATASTASTASASSGTGGAPVACVHWSVATPTPIALTDPSGDSLLTGFANGGLGVIVATMNNDTPSVDPTWRARFVSYDLSMIGDSNVVAQHTPTALIGGMNLAFASSKEKSLLGGLLWDAEQGCRFFNLAQDGTSAASTSLGPAWCYWLAHRPDGFFAAQSSTLEFAPLDVLQLDTSGHVLVSSPAIGAQPHPTQPLRVVRFPDETTLMMWSNGSTAVAAQRVDDDGNALSMIDPEVLDLDLPMHVALTGFDGGGVLAWATSSGKDQVWTRAVDESGYGVPANDTLVMENDGLGIGGVDVVSVDPIDGADQVALLAWAKGEVGIPSQIFVVPVSGHTGVPIDAQLVVPVTQEVSALRLVKVDGGAILLFDGEEIGGKVQVFAMRLDCGP